MRPPLKASLLAPALYVLFLAPVTNAAVTPPGQPLPTRGASTPLARGSYEEGELLVRLHDEPNLRAADVFADHNVDMLEYRPAIRVFRVATRPGRTIEQAMRDLAADPRVTLVQPNFIYRMSIFPQDPLLVDLPTQPNQWGIFKTFVPSLWRTNNGGAGEVIAFVDTGTDLVHVDLAGNLWSNPGEVAGNSMDDDGNGYVDDVNGWDVVNQDGVPADDNNHGTHVAGIACARSNTVGITGVAPAAQIMTVKVLNGSGDGNSMFVAEGIEYASREGADIINMSLNVPVIPSDPDADCIVEEACAHATSRGAILVGSSGNNSQSTVQMPANFDGVIAVGAVGANEVVPDFSSYGADLDVVAPGVGIWSTIPGGAPDSMSGTSQAAPFVSGVCALIHQQFPTMRAWELEAYLRTQARDVDPTPANRDGYGMVSFGTLHDYSNGALPAAWSENRFWEWLGADVTGESGTNDVGALGADDGDDDMRDLDGPSNAEGAGDDGADDGLFPGAFGALPLMPMHLGPAPNINVIESVGDRTGPRYAGGATIAVRSWADWNSNNVFAGNEILLNDVTPPATWGANTRTASRPVTLMEPRTRGNPLRIRTRLYGPGAAPGTSTGQQTLGEVEDQLVLNFVEDADTTFHAALFATLASTGPLAIRTDPPPFAFIVAPPHHNNWHYITSTGSCAFPINETVVFPEEEAPPLDTRELTRCRLQFWAYHGVMDCPGWHCDPGPNIDNCRVSVRPYNAMGVAQPEVDILPFPEIQDPKCFGPGWFHGDAVTENLDAFVGGYIRIVFHHETSQRYDNFAIDDIRVFGDDDQLPLAVTFGAASVSNLRVATVNSTHPRENTVAAPSDPRGNMYGARLWGPGGSWTSSFPLTPRDFTSGFPVPGAPGAPLVSNVRVPSVFPTYSYGLREDDEVRNQGAESSVGMTAAPTFSVDVAATVAQVNVSPGDTVKIAFVTTSMGNALDAISSNSSDEQDWILCNRAWINVLDPLGGAVDSVEIGVPSDAKPGTTNLLVVADSSLSNPAMQDTASTLIVVQAEPPCAHIADHDAGNVRFSVTDLGIHGFLSHAQTTGSGFVFPKVGGINRVFIGGFWAATDSMHVLNSEHLLDNIDWQPVDCLEFVEGVPPADEQGTGTYSDTGHPSPPGLVVTQRSYSWGTPPDDDYVIVVHDVKNMGATPLSGVWLGEYVDWDWGSSVIDLGGTDAARDLAYMYHAGGTEAESLHIGLVGLYPDDMPQLSFVDNPTYIYPTFYLPDADRYHFLKGDLPEYVVPTTPAPSDWSAVVGVGPFSIAAGDSVTVAFAFVGGTTRADLLANVDAAQAMWIAMFDPRTDVSSLPIIAPSRLEFSGGSPNPFRQLTTLRFGLPREEVVALDVFDVSGRRVVSVVDDRPMPAGYHALAWRGSDSTGRRLPAGVYFLRLKVGTEKMSRKVVLQR